VTRALALVIAVAAVLGVQYVSAITGRLGSAGTALALGFALLGAGVVGDVLKRFHVPPLTGYLLFGALVGPYLGNVITESMAGQLQIVTGTATTLIALIAGLALSTERLGKRLWSIVYVTGTTLTVVIVGLAIAAWIA
jgi:NhaP-type Na+/H+ or K+/H+ antiporter